MKGYFKKFIILMFIVFFFVNLGFTQIKNKVYINRVNSVNGELIEPAKAYLINKLKVLGFEIVYQRENADYMLDMNIISASSRREFNWLIILLPIWPIVPLTTVEGEAIVAIRVYDMLGNELIFDQTGAIKKGMWFFGDFVSGSSVIKGAVNDCINTLLGRLNVR